MFGFIVAVLISQVQITGYSTLSFGMTEQKMRKEFQSKWDCKTYKDGTRYCITKDTKNDDLSGIAAMLVDGKIIHISLRTKYTRSEQTLIAQWYALKEIFNVKYGDPSFVVEEMMYPYENTKAEFLRHGITAIKLEKCKYLARWDVDDNWIGMSMSDSFVNVMYVSKEYNLIAASNESKKAGGF